MTLFHGQGHDASAAGRARHILMRARTLIGGDRIIFIVFMASMIALSLSAFRGLTGDRKELGELLPDGNRLKTLNRCFICDRVIFEFEQFGDDLLIVVADANHRYHDWHF